ncbi:MAG: aminotransferase class III-fold pyridoxal phosphate-dependent enzyme, partial [Gaiellaceae bacterium]
MSQRVLAERDLYVARGIAAAPIVVDRAEGARVWDVDGRSYVDFAGGIACQNTGHGFEPVVAAIHEQAGRYLHQCFMVGAYEPYVGVCKRLAELSQCGSGEQRSILLNSGAEGVENAVKIARAATGRPAVIVFENAFHGRTLLTMTMTAKLVYKKGFGPFAPEVYRAPGPYPYRGVSSDAALEALEDLFRSDVDPE